MLRIELVCVTFLLWVTCLLKHLTAGMRLFPGGMGIPDGSVVKNIPVTAGEVHLIPGSGRSPAEGNDNPLQYSCLENSTYLGALSATVHGVIDESDMT